MKRITLVLFSLLIFSLQAQLSEDGKPFTLEQEIQTELSRFSLPALDMNQIMLEDVENGKNGELERAAVIRPANLNMYNSGVWTSLENGDRIWRLEIEAQEAKGITLLFKDFYLPKGSKLFLYQPDYSQIIGAFTEANNHESKQFTTELIHGDKVVLEYYEPKVKSFQGNFTIEGIAHLYKAAPWQVNTYDFDDSDPCQVNINCSEGNAWQDEKKGVARIFVVSGGSGGWCTGSLVNNTNADCRPYFLTAYHCGDNSSTQNFNNYVFYFNYEASGCTTPNFESSVTSNPDYFTITGCSVVSSSNNGGSSSSDFLLVEFNSNIPTSEDVYYNGWNRTASNTLTSNGVSIHHPAGDIKKISTYTQTLTTTGWNGSGLSSHWRVYWDASANGHGVTEGGSSGSPIFNDQGQIIGTLTGGGSYCTNLNASDSYGKMSYHWNTNGTATNRRVDVHLDPAGNGSATSMDGSASPCATSVGLDAGISLINEPITDICGAAFTPEVVLRNFGSITLTSCQIKYQVTGSGVQTYNWSGSLGSGSTTNVTLNAMNASNGSNTFTAYTENPNGGNDLNAGNNSKSVTFNVISGDPLPLTQNFQLSTFPPTNYDLFNGDSDITWERTTSAGFNSSASMFIDNWDYNGNGAYDWFVLPSVDLSNTSNATITFDYAYAYYNGTQGTFYDSLAVAYSLDCGNSWFALYYEGGTQLATAGGLGTEFTPTSSQWQNESVDLNVPALIGQDNVQLAFVAINGYGNNLYIDNINIQGISGGQTPTANFTASTTSICEGSQVTFNSGSSQNASSFSWSFPGGTPSTSNVANPVITYNNPGIYNVSLTATNANGNDTETQTNYITVSAGPNLIMSSTGATCNGINNGSASVVATGGAGNYSYAWTGTNSTNSIVNGLAPGSYTVTVTDGNQCMSMGTASVSASVTINILLTTLDNSATGGVSSISSAVSGGASPYTYSWDNGATSTSIDSLTLGWYNLTVTDANGCQGTAFSSIGNVSIEEPEWLSYISLYPNPTNGFLSVDLSIQGTDNIDLKVMNAIGQIMIQKELDNFSSGTEVIDLNDAAEGVYFLRISDSEHSKILKFIKRN